MSNTASPIKYCKQTNSTLTAHLRVIEVFVPRLFEEKRWDIDFGFPSFRPSFRPPIGVCTLCAQLLQFHSDSFETLQMSSSCFEDVHVVWI